jgi:hypothetical protein
MNRGVAASLLAAVAATCTPAMNGAPLERSVSSSRQFVVYGPDAHLRAGMCDFAERAKKKALTALQQPDEWKTPIVLYVQPPQANLPDAPPAQLNFSQTGFGLKLQLDLTVGPDANGPALERELLRAIYLEIMYRRSRTRRRARHMSRHRRGCSMELSRARRIAMPAASRRVSERSCTRRASCRSRSFCVNGLSCSIRRRGDCMARIRQL